MDCAPANWQRRRYWVPRSPGDLRFSALFGRKSWTEPSNEEIHEWSPEISNPPNPRNSHRSGSMLQRGKLDRQGLVEWQVPDLVWKSLTPGGLKKSLVGHLWLIFAFWHGELSKIIQKWSRYCQRLLILSSAMFAMYAKVTVSYEEMNCKTCSNFDPTRLHWHSIHPKDLKGNFTGNDDCSYALGQSAPLKCQR